MVPSRSMRIETRSPDSLFRLPSEKLVVPRADQACSASITVDFPPLFGPTKTVIPLPALPVGCANRRLCSSEKPRKPSMFNLMTVIGRLCYASILVDNAVVQHYSRLPPCLRTTSTL